MPAASSKGGASRSAMTTPAAPAAAATGRQRSQPPMSAEQQQINANNLTINSSAAQEYMRSLTPQSASMLLKPQTASMAASQSSHSLRGMFVPPNANESSFNSKSSSAAMQHSATAQAGLSVAQMRPHSRSGSHLTADAQSDEDDDDENSNDIPTQCTCWENQRYYPIVGWSAKLLLTDRPSWSNESGSLSLTFTDFSLPPGWQWRDDQWLIDRNTPSIVCDSEGWQYAVEFSTHRSVWDAHKDLKHIVRRRRWLRRRYNTAQNAASSHSNESSQQHSALDHSRLRTKLVASGSGRAHQLMLSPAAMQQQQQQQISTPTLQQSNSARNKTQHHLLQPNSPGAALYNRQSTSRHSPGGGAQPAPPPVVEHVTLWQYERYYPLVKWSDSLLPTDRVKPWSDAQFKRSVHKDMLRPGPEWKWRSEWQAVITEGET